MELLCCFQAWSFLYRKLFWNHLKTSSAYKKCFKLENVDMVYIISTYTIDWARKYVIKWLGLTTGLLLFWCLKIICSQFWVLFRPRKWTKTCTINILMIVWVVFGMAGSKKYVYDINTNLEQLQLFENLPKHKKSLTYFIYGWWIEVSSAWTVNDTADRWK